VLIASKLNPLWFLSLNLYHILLATQCLLELLLGDKMPFIKINNINLFYETEGQGEPVLFLHGLGSSTLDWEYQRPYFAKNYQVISVDIRGHGQSDKVKSAYSIALFADDIAKFIKSSAIAAKKVNIVGISMGGMIALQLAIDHPEVVKSIVVANSVASFKLKTLADKYQYFKRQMVVKFIGMHKMGEIIASRLFPDEKFAEVRKIFADRWATNDKNSYLNSMNAIKNWSVENRLEQIQCPCLILTGDKDYGPISQKELLAKRIKNAQLKIIQNSRHASPVDQKEKFNSIVEQFLKELN